MRAAAGTCWNSQAAGSFHSSLCTDPGSCLLQRKMGPADYVIVALEKNLRASRGPLGSFP